MAKEVRTSYTATTEDAGLRVDKVLSRHPEIGTRSRAEKLLALGLVLLKTKAIKASYKVSEGELFEIVIPVVDSELVPYDIPLNIVHEDDDVLVVNKPAGLVVHPAEGHAQDTLVNALIGQAKNLSMGFHERRPGIVHRLDRDTSGLLVVAKNDFAQEKLAAQFQDRSVHRIYWSVVFGRPKTAAGTIKSSLGRHPTDRKRFANVTTGGKAAVTNYNLVSTYQEELSLLHLKLETGRTHQIRVHLSELGHPIAGDTVYGADRRIKSVKAVELRNIISGMNRFALHAAELGFRHPSTGEELRFRAGWPEDLLELVRFCKWI